MEKQNSKNNKSKIIYLVLGLISIITIIAVLIISRIEPPKIEPPIGAIITPAPNVEEIDKPSIMTNVIIETNKGNIKIGLFDNHRPITVNNFLSLIEKDFYDRIIFHRVIDDFMIQAGCPYGTGFGGPGYVIECELEGYNRNMRGTISMANAGLNTGGSQFFINLVNNHHLNELHSVFGRVIEGIEIVDAISNVVTGQGNRPIEDVVIKNIEIIKE